MYKPPLREINDNRTELLPLRVEQYHRMIAEGILEEGAPFELLGGVLMRKDRSAVGEDPMTVSYEHAWAVTRLAGLSPKLERFGCYMRVQLPITLPPLHEPEPDGAIVVGADDDYVDHHPYARDVLCVIEVADASLRRDRTTKLEAYAKHRIAQYVIVNLADRVVEVYTEPTASKRRYESVATLTRSQSLILPTAGTRKLTVPARQILP